MLEASQKRVIVTTSWDDGHKLDVKLAELLRKYQLPATFYIAPEDREFPRSEMLTDEQITELGRDFEVGGHTITHPRLPQVSDEQAIAEMTESRRRLKELTGQEVDAFCYPCGSYEARHIEMARTAGYTYARTVKRHSYELPRQPLEARTTIHTYSHYLDLGKIAVFARFRPSAFIRYLRWDNLAKAMFDRTLRTGGVYHLWGHSWEIEKRNEWQRLESVLSHIAGHEQVTYRTNSSLVAPRA